MKGKDLTYGIYKCENGYLWMVNAHKKSGGEHRHHPFCIVFGGGDTTSLEDLCTFASYKKEDFLAAFGEDEFERVL